MPRLRIRPARPTDLPWIVHLERLSFAAPWTPAMLREELERRQGFWVLEEGRRILGYICFWLVGDEAHLLNLAVHPGRRRQGLGSRLLSLFLALARRRGAARALLEVRASNLAAQKLYRRFGFRVDGRRRGYYRPGGEDAILMSKTLQPVEDLPPESRRET